MKSAVIFGSSREVSPIFEAEMQDLVEGLKKNKYDVVYGNNQQVLAGDELVIALPGGIGTLNKITEVLALKELGEFAGPVVFLNILDSWQPLLDYFFELRERNMLSENFATHFEVWPSSRDFLSSTIATTTTRIHQ